MTHRFDQAAFNRFVIDNRVIGFFDQPITLKSGRKSYWYVNWRTVSEDAFLLNTLADFVLAFARHLDESGRLPLPESFYGVPEGATKVALITQMKFASSSKNFGPGSHAIPMGRGKPKEHGVPKDKYFLGMPRGRTCLIEDVTTTGGSLLTTIAQLKEAGISMSGAFGLTNRMERRDDGLSVADALAKEGVPYFHMSDATELLPQAVKMLKPPATVSESITREFKEFGVRELVL